MTFSQPIRAAAKVATFIIELPVLVLFGILGLLWKLLVWIGIADLLFRLARRFAATKAGQTYLAAQCAFLEVESDGGLEEQRRKAAEKVRLFAWYNMLDAVLAGAFAWLILILSAFGLSPLVTMLVAIGFDILVPIPFLYLAFAKGQDLTLGTDFRRALDALRKAAPFVWAISLAASIVRGAIWNGPEYVIMFFRKELHTFTRVALTLVILAVFQALFWGWLWMLGYDSAIEPLWELLVSLTR